MESHLSINPLQANLQDLTQAATNLQADLATTVGTVLVFRSRYLHDFTTAVWG